MLYSRVDGVSNCTWLLVLGNVLHLQELVHEHTGVVHCLRVFFKVAVFSNIAATVGLAWACRVLLETLAEGLINV